VIDALYVRHYTLYPSLSTGSNGLNSWLVMAALIRVFSKMVLATQMLSMHCYH
jgi:hypothetical protein